MLVPVRDPADSRILAVVRNNAEWCAAVCRAHGIGGTFGPRAWLSAAPAPPLYPDAVTLVPEATAADVVAAHKVKDSFAALDLAGRVLFDAQWIHRDAATRNGGRTALRWRQTADLTDVFPKLPAPLAADPRVRVYAAWDAGEVVGGAITFEAAGVAGVTNAFLTVEDDLWTGLLDAIEGDGELVGYEHGPALKAAFRHGFRALGPLRIWETDQS
jgi:hypothetical protein